jgi:hypothetical protein
LFDKHDERDEIVVTIDRKVVWRVMFRAKEGVPRDLAYRIERLVIDAAIDADIRNGEPPKGIRLGTIPEICERVGVNRTSGKNMQNIRDALYQLHGTVIDVSSTISKRWSKYQSIYFTGDEKDGVRTDAVYILLSDEYLNVLAQSSRRPLDYDYLRDLPGAAARLYELIAPRMYAALKSGQKNATARMLYSEICIGIGIMRQLDRRRMYKQMYKLHQPHILSRYFTKVDYQTKDEGNDWMIVYTPGEKARREFRATTGKEVENRPSAEVIDITETRVEPVQAQLPLPATKPLTDAQALAQRLVKAGVWITKAQALIELYPEAAEAWADVYESGFLEKKSDPAAYLAKAISENAQPPKRYRGRKKALERLAQDEGRRKTESDWGREEIAAMHEYLDRLSIEEAEQFERSVIESLSAGQQKILESLNPGKARSQAMEDFRLKYWRARK